MFRHDPRPHAVGWRAMLVALGVGLIAAVPAVVLAFVCLLFVAASGGWCEVNCGSSTGSSEWTAVLIGVGLSMVVAAAVAAGVVLVLRRQVRWSSAAVVGLALGVGVTGGSAALYADTSSGFTLGTVVVTAAWMILWVPGARWWINRQAPSAGAVEIT